MDKAQPILAFDFDRWSSIASADPEQFEAMRSALLEQMLEQSPAAIKHRMQGLQWRIDQVRNQSSTPMAACLRISQMMWNSLLGEQGLLTALETPDKLLRRGKGTADNKVIPLNKPGKKR